MSGMDVTNFENILAKISDIILPKERLGGTNLVQAAERLALTLHFLAAGETFQSLSFQYRISLNIARTSSKVVVKLSLNKWQQSLSKSRRRKQSGSTFPKGLKNNGIYQTLWEQLTGNMSEFKSRKMVVSFTIITYILLPLF